MLPPTPPQICWGSLKGSPSKKSPSYATVKWRVSRNRGTNFGEYAHKWAKRSCWDTGKESLSKQNKPGFSCKGHSLLQNNEASSAVHDIVEPILGKVFTLEEYNSLALAKVVEGCSCQERNRAIYILKDFNVGS